MKNRMMTDCKMILEERAKVVKELGDDINTEMARLIRDMPHPEASQAEVEPYKQRLLDIQDRLLDLMVVTTGGWKPK